jgi:hypothetical protein
MDNNFIRFGVASLQLIPIFTLTYLQNEIAIITKILVNIQPKLLSRVAMFISFCLIFISMLSMEQWIRILISILLIITLSMSINYTYKDYTLDEGEDLCIPRRIFLED